MWCSRQWQAGHANCSPSAESSDLGWPSRPRSRLRHATLPSLAGARVLDLFQVGVVQGNVTVGVGVLSYAGQLNVSIFADADAVPDLKAFADGLADALARLGTQAAAGGARGDADPPFMPS